MTFSSVSWPTETRMEYSTKQRWVCTAFIALILPVSIGISWFFEFLYVRSPLDRGSFILNACIYAMGFIAVVCPVMWYLRTFSFMSVVFIFGECFGLVLVLVTFKRYLTDRYDDIAGSDATALAAFVSYVSAATLEECLKLIVFATPLVFFKRFRTVYDAVWFGCLSGVSFATIENLILTHRSILIALQRFVWCTATHTSDLLVGVLFFLYMKSDEHRLVPDKWYLYPLILILPIALHGTFDFVIFYGRIADEVWICRMSLLVGAVSLVLCFGMFYPLRRRPIKPPEEPAYPVPSCPYV
jgi:RsiW-degrading membrane proteinase PrsW (M82 family)